MRRKGARAHLGSSFTRSHHENNVPLRALRSPLLTLLRSNSSRALHPAHTICEGTMATNPDATPEDLDARRSTMGQGVIQPHLGPLVSQLTPLVAQLQARQDPTSNESHVIRLSFFLSYHTPPPSPIEGGERLLSGRHAGSIPGVGPPRSSRGPGCPSPSGQGEASHQSA